MSVMVMLLPAMQPQIITAAYETRVPPWQCQMWGLLRKWTVSHNAEENAGSIAYLLKFPSVYPPLGYWTVAVKIVLRNETLGRAYWICIEGILGF
jgi:hypothetical protein